MSNVWERFEGIASVDEVNEAKEAFSNPSPGTYEVVLDKIEASLTQEGLPMLKGQFSLLEGGRKIFYNHKLQNINYPQYTASLIEEARKFVEKLIGEDVEYEGVTKLAELVETIICGEKYVIKVSYGKKDIEMKYPKVSVVKKIEDEVEYDPTGEGNEELTPF